MIRCKTCILSDQPVTESAFHHLPPVTACSLDRSCRDRCNRVVFYTSCQIQDYRDKYAAKSNEILKLALSFEIMTQFAYAFAFVILVLFVPLCIYLLKI